MTTIATIAAALSTTNEAHRLSRLASSGGTVRWMPPVWIGLTVAFASALVTNTAYSLEHDAAAALPPLTPRRPFRSAKLLLGDRRWLIAFGAETAGWLMYVAALRLAPLSLVQAVAASGVAVLAFATARGHPSRLARREQAAVVLAVAGLVLLALSLVDTAESDQRPAVLGVIIWLAACGGAAVLLIAVPTRFARAASLGLAAGLLFADGDISAKLVGYGGWWLVALASLIVAYAVGTSVLQWAYQRGDALTSAAWRRWRRTRSRSRPGSCCSARHCRTGCAPCCRSRRSPAWSRARSRSGVSRRHRPIRRLGAWTVPGRGPHRLRTHPPAWMP